MHVVVLKYTFLSEDGWYREIRCVDVLAEY